MRIDYKHFGAAFSKLNNDHALRQIWLEKDQKIWKQNTTANCHVKDKNKIIYLDL